MSTAVSAAPFDPAPWQADLRQMRGALETRYANYDWLTKDRGVDLDRLFARTDGEIAKAADAGEAKGAFDRLVRRIADGHVAIEWPTRSAPPATAAPTPKLSLCERLGYQKGDADRGTAATLPGWRALPGASAFAAGIVPVAGQTVGTLRIAVFQPEHLPGACAAALAQLKLADDDRPCDEGCSGKVIEAAYQRLNADLAERLRALKAAGATALLLDLGGNGGGSEWAEAVARMLTPKRLRAAPIAFRRGPAMADYWRSEAKELRAAVPAATPADKVRLEGWAGRADRFAADAACTGCGRLAPAAYATGYLAEAVPGDLDDKPWGWRVFSAAQHHYREGVWAGPLMVLVDGETWSAAEEVAAMLQDNRAAMIVGGRTGGAGCGHAYGLPPVTLANSGAKLGLPDCVRLRADGTNEVSGIVPDVAVAMRPNDGAALKARLIMAALPEALRRAAALD